MKESWAEICAYIGPRLMHDFGLSAPQAAGVLGNIGRESGGGRWLTERGSGSGRGLCQWTGPRARSFEAWCAHHGVSSGSLDGNYGYLKFELSGAYAACIAKLKRCATLEAAVPSFCNSFERPSIPAMSDRVHWGRSALAAFSPGHPAAVAPPPRAARRPVADKHHIGRHRRG